MKNQWSTTVSDWQGVDDEPTAGSDNLVKSGGVEHVIATLIINEGNLLISKDDNDTSYTITFPSSYYISFGKSVVKPSVTVLSFTPWNDQNITKIVYNIETGDIQAVRRDLALSSKQIFLFAINVNNKTTTLPIDKYRFATNNDLYSQILASLTQDSLYHSLYSAGIINPTYTSGTRITKNGIPESNSSWSISEQIHLNRGEYLFFRASTSNSASLISKVNATDPVTYTPLSIASGTGIWDAYYYATDAIDVVLCIRYPASTIIYKVTSVIIASVLTNLSDVSTRMSNHQNQIDSINKNILIDKNSAINVTFEDGYYINKNGVKTASANMSMTNIIALSAGETIVVEWKTEGTVISTISQVTEEGGETIYTPLLVSGRRVDDSQFLFDYYTATTSCNVVVSTRHKEVTTVYKLSKSGMYEFLLRNINNIFSGIAELNEKLYTLPSTWASKIEDVNTDKKDKFCFAIQTDTHYKVGDGIDYGNDIKEFSKYVGLDFAINLGDIIEGYADMTKEIYRESMTEIVERYVNGICCPFFYCKGNHESNAAYANTLPNPADGYIYNDELYGRIMSQVKNTIQDVSLIRGKFYYYKDFDDIDIRVIFLDTNDGTGGIDFGISDTQLTWFINTALNTTKKIIVMSHVPLINNIASDEGTHNNNESIRQVLAPLSNFKTGGGTVIGCFCGHIHEDESKQNDGIWHISFDNGAVGSVVVVDTENKSITIKTLGYSNNRTFSYT